MRVPVSADVESGYDTPAAELVERVLDAGAVGINVEEIPQPHRLAERGW